MQVSSYCVSLTFYSAAMVTAEAQGCWNPSCGVTQLVRMLSTTPPAASLQLFQQLAICLICGGVM